ncbi:hypothetical protein LOTGIDRAFT_175928 [Lottia gigantea]|uniref:Ubiquitin-like protease family profile domain-containing protein n=1 Tax=Lottia gigantea TaxID=225164 RepID=V3ZZ67_LOTGI|nr:hypothetical protein LOTGIDRAFT_175928 [Lottia gigantea]ESO87930.1 hypothetical protein LOTGIDRAFT_175928 [Lottia gigantea]
MSWKSTSTAKFWWIGKPLYTSQLEEGLACHIPEQFAGVLARNQLQTLQPTRYPSAYVVNTDDAGQPGKHWTVFVCEKDHCDFFDSFGCSPEVYGQDFADFARRQGPLRHNTRRIQGNQSSVCGHYCFFYLCHKFHEPSPHALSVFQSNLTENDCLVHAWAHHHFPCLSFEDGETCLGFMNDNMLELMDLS